MSENTSGTSDEVEMRLLVEDVSPQCSKGVALGALL